MMKISNFVSDLLRVLIVVVLIYSVHLMPFGEMFNMFKPMIYIILGFVELLFMYFMFDDINDFLIIKYRLKPDYFDKYITQGLYLWCGIIPHWKSIHVKWHSCKYQNLFGAKLDSAYSTNESYSKEESLKKLEYHKHYIKRHREDYFKFKKKEKTQYIDL